MANRDSARFLARVRILLFGNDSTRFLSRTSCAPSGDVEERFYRYPFSIVVVDFAIRCIHREDRMKHRRHTPLLGSASLLAVSRPIRSSVLLVFWPRTNPVDASSGSDA